MAAANLARFMVGYGGLTFGPGSHSWEFWLCLGPWQAAGVIAILESSEGEVVGTWAGGIRPNTFIAIGALFSNVLLAFAFSQGLVLSYWRQCLHQTSLDDIHYAWEAGQSVLGACMGIMKRHSRINALALTVLTLSAVRSPLNQAAAGVSSSTVFRNGTLDLQVVPQIPEGYTGIIASTRFSEVTTATALQQNFSTIVRGYNARSPMKLEHADCGDKCSAVVNTFGFCATCDFKTRSISPEQETAIEECFTLFSISTDYWIQGDGLAAADPATPVYAGLILRVLYVSDGQNEGNSTQVNKTCYLQPSVMTTTVNLTGDNEVALQGHWKDDRCTSPLNYTVPTAAWDGGVTTIGGFLFVLQDMYGSSADFLNQGSTNSDEVRDIIGNQYIVNGSNGIANGGALTWADPTDDILDALRELSFRTSLFVAAEKAGDPDLAYAEGVRSTRVVPFAGTSNKPVYKTHRGYMGAGFAASVLGVAGVALLYRGWWELGRKTTMSPIEIALAFDAPLLRGVDSNAEVQDIVRQAGKSQIRYGNVSDYGRHDGQMVPRRLRFEDSRVVERPQNGEKYC